MEQGLLSLHQLMIKQYFIERKESMYLFKKGTAFFFLLTLVSSSIPLARAEVVNQPSNPDPAGTMGNPGAPNPETNGQAPGTASSGGGHAPAPGSGGAPAPASGSGGGHAPAAGGSGGHAPATAPGGAKGSA